MTTKFKNLSLLGYVLFCISLISCSNNKDIELEINGIEIVGKWIDACQAPCYYEFEKNGTVSYGETNNGKNGNYYITKKKWSYDGEVWNLYSTDGTESSIIQYASFVNNKQIKVVIIEDGHVDERYFNKVE